MQAFSFFNHLPVADKNNVDTYLFLYLIEREKKHEYL